MKYLKEITIFFICFSFCVRVSADGRWTHITEINGYQVGVIRSVAVGPDGSVWFGGDKGLFRYFNDQWEIVRSSEYIASVAIGSDGTIWVSNFSNVLLKYENGTWISYKVGGESAPSICLQFLSVAPDGSVWGDSSDEGLYRFDGETWTQYTVEDGLCHNDVSRLTVGPDGDVWCRYGTADAVCEEGMCNFFGVSHFDGETWETFDVYDGLLNNRVNAIAVSQNGFVSISYTDGGISLFDGETWKTISTEYNMGELVFGPNGILWNTNFSGEVLRSYHSGIWTVYEGMPVVPWINSMVVDYNGMLWFGTYNEIVIYEPSTIVIKNRESVPSELSIICNYPNPFNVSTTIQFSIHKKEVIDLSIYSITGQSIRNLIFEQMATGVYSVIWNGSDDNGIPVASGMYISRLSSNEQTAINRMVLIK